MLPTVAGHLWYANCKGVVMDNDTLFKAVRANDLKTLTIVCANPDVLWNWEKAVEEALMDNHLECGRVLIETMSTLARDNRFQDCLFWACGSGCYTIIDLLRPLVGIEERFNFITEACSCGDLRAVKALMNAHEAQLDNSYFLRVAVVGEHVDVIEYLFELSDPVAVLQSLLSKPESSEQLIGFLQERIAQKRLRDNLIEVVQLDIQRPARGKKI